MNNQATELPKDYGSFPRVDLSQIDPDTSLIALIPYSLAKRYQVLPLFRQERELTLAMKDPSKLSTLNDLEFLTGLQIIPVMAEEEELSHAIEKIYSSVEEHAFDNMVEDMDLMGDGLEPETIEASEHELDIGKLRESAEGTPVVKLVNILLSEAIRRGASDIHLEPYEKSFRVRMRVDGVLQQIMSPPKSMQAAVTSRLKIMSSLNIAERRLPQDGRMKVKFQGREIDFRVSTLPALHGEKVVLRLLDKSSVSMDINTLGFNQQEMDDFSRAISMPWGMLLVTGPTGSGKSTTLYAALNHISHEGINIMTVEDPVEYNIDGVNQFQTYEKIGLNFARVLRSFLRQDPDVIMVGEMRDKETAEIGVKAALTGHLVLSTLHTNDSPSTITRLIDMEIEPYLIASSVNLVMSQRLVRRICQECKEPTEYSPAYLKNMGFKEEELSGMTLYKGSGCSKCNDTGYKGRMALFEIMAVRGDMIELISKGASTDEIREVARNQGLRTLRECGIARIKEGLTSVDEVVRVTAEVQ
jgi:type IV pilus assembly protein PilB